MQVVCCQTDIVWEEKSANFERVRQMLRDARPEPGALVVLPEMFATGFSMNVAALAEDENGPTAKFLSELAREFSVNVLGGLITRGASGKGRNEAFAFTPEGALTARYCKLHPFSFATETTHYERGNTPVLWNVGGFSAGLSICYDLRFPELYRRYAQTGATLLIAIANWPYPRDEHWVTLLRARAIENQSYVVGVNRCGKDAKLTYPGRSLVLSPKGEVLADGGDTCHAVLAQIEPGVVAEWRANFPALKDVHPELPR